MAGFLQSRKDVRDGFSHEEAGMRYLLSALRDFMG
jgi:hypothetical protein